MNVFIVTSPLQLINALEAKAHFKTENNLLIVFRNTAQGHLISTFKRLVNESDWQRVVYLSLYGDELLLTPSRGRRYLLVWQQRRALRRLAKKLGKVEGLFVGEFRDALLRDFACALGYERYVTFDDGTDSLEFNLLRQERFQRRLTPLRASFRDRLLGLNPRQPERVTLFTVYDIAPLPGDTVVPNRYSAFREQLSDKPTSCETWFLGGPLARDGYVTPATHLSYLRRVQEMYRAHGKRFVYIAHSREPETALSEIRDRLGCEVRSFGLPIEHVLKDAEPRPAEVGSFISSALVNCRILFGSALPLTAFVLESHDLLDHHAFIRDVYAQFKRLQSATFRVLEVPPA